MSNAYAWDEDFFDPDIATCVFEETPTLKIQGVVRKLAAPTAGLLFVWELQRVEPGEDPAVIMEEALEKTKAHAMMQAVASYSRMHPKAK